MDSPRDVCRGRWKHEILPALGIGHEFLRNQHGPCPVCGGKDRYRFDDLDGNGTFICNQCGAGDGFTLLKLTNGWGFKQTLEEIERVISEGLTRKPERPKRDFDVGEALRAFIGGAKRVQPGDATHEYLQARGLASVPDTLWTHPRAFHKETGREYPCMVGIVTAPDGENISAHRVFLDGPKKADIPGQKMMYAALRDTNGAAVRLYESSGETLAVAEGIETAIAVHELTGLPCWSTVNATLMASFEPPQNVARLLIYADHDWSHTGHAAAYALSKRMRGRGLETEVHIPDAQDTDWLDFHQDKLRLPF